MNQGKRNLLLLLTAVTLGGCASTDTAPPPALESQARWVVLPFVNTTETPLAAQRAQVLAHSLLGARGITDVQLYPKTPRDTIFGPDSEAPATAEALQWARQQGMRYALTGEVFEWRYKVGVDGEPAVGLNIRVIDVGTGKTLWTGTRSQSGWSRDSLGKLAQDVMRVLIASATSGIKRP
jgi:polysaccharide biosynthesis protein PelC